MGGVGLSQTVGEAEGVTDKEQARLDRLTRRANFLEQRIAQRREHAIHHDAEELSALRWAVDFIRGALDADPD